jgi:hypothetical protein
MKKGGPDDPKGLIYESFRIDGIDAAQCRTIFLDWALSLPLETDTSQAIKGMIVFYGEEFAGHPMLGVLNEGLQTMAAPRRRGGWRSRNRS